ncbi:MAG: copper amine oxidase N-terminal domain-containing protein [Caldisericia bacterium]|nr:copper amine oxidase N-terminal domain-containing protein [Caldisericia bacterium]
MRKLLSILVIALFLCGMMPLDSHFMSVSEVSGASLNKSATMGFLDMYPAHSNASGIRLGTVDTPFTYERFSEVDSRSFQWERKGTNYWGRYSPEDEDSTYLMPYTPQAKDLAGTPEKVISFGLESTYPKYWAEFYLTVHPDGGLSQETDKWYIVLDDGGQIWFDPDGAFNDPRYQAKADPGSSRYVPGSNASNPMARIDPVRSNNTQGPYVIDPIHPDYRPRIFFWDRDMTLKQGTNRTWQLGWVNRPEYMREGGVNDDESVSDGLVRSLDWEVNPLTNWVWNPYQGEPVSPNGYTLTAVQFPFTPEDATYYHDTNNNNTYDSGEYIYRKSYDPLITPIPPDNAIVEANDYRLTPTSVLVGDETFNYGASETYPVKTGAHDIDLALKSFRNFVGHDIRFVNNKVPGIAYNPGEYIYRVHGNLNIIKTGDTRLTNISVTGNYTASSKDFSFSEIFADKDVLVLLEVLEANGCSGSKYDISVETNVWEGSNPSTATAVLRSPNGEFGPMASRIQKNTVLDPAGDEFQVPACTFSDIQINYRSYVGIELFRDNGEDNNIGKNTISDSCLYNSAGDEYRKNRTCEEYLGCTDGITGIPDAGRQITKFHEYMLYHDTDSRINGLGCNETIYEKKNKQIPDPTDPYYYTVQEGDMRHTPVTIERNGNFIDYAIGTNVMPGDADVGLSLNDLWEDVTYIDPGTGTSVTERIYKYKYFDEPKINILETLENAEVWVCDDLYQYGEVIYHDANNNFLVDEGDTRLSECEISGLIFDCGSKIEGDTEYYSTTHINHMVKMGQNGNSRFFDIFVLPGELDVNIDIDRPLKVEQTSTVRMSLNNMAALKDGQKVWVSVREPKPKDRDTDELGKMYDIILDEDGFIGITDDMRNLMPSNGYNYYGNNRYFYQTLWGAGNDGFHIDNSTFDRTYITEDGMMALYRGYPKYPEPYYPFEYRYDNSASGGTAYGGRPYPYSNSSQYGGYRYPLGYWRYNNTYQNCYFPWDLMMLKNTWIIPMGGQWHVPTQGRYYPYYYRTIQGYGVFYIKTADSLRIVWRLLSNPFKARDSNYNYDIRSYGDYTRPHQRANVARWTSEFEVIITRAGTITFNYSDRNNGQQGINVPSYVYLRNGDVLRNGQFFDEFDPYSSEMVTDPNIGCAYESVPYIPIIGVSCYETSKAQVAPWSYGGATQMNNADWLNGKTMIWGPPEPPDEDLYNQKMYTAYGYIDKDNPVFEFQYTPYRGSCNDGFHGMDGFHAGTSLFNQLEIKAFADLGGVSNLVPPDSDYTGSFQTNYKDPFWIRSLFNKQEWQENYRKVPFIIDPSVPLNTSPGDIPNQYGKHFESIRNVYDCYAVKKFDIAPEDLDIVPMKKCIDLVSSRQPAIQYHVYDHDNPDDVNDPANVQFMSHKWFAGEGPYPNNMGEYDYGVDLKGSKEIGTYGRPMIMNYNAHGAGIDYFFTALSGYGQKWQRYIIQVNTDGSYEFWRWFEGDLPGQVFGAFDQHDFLYTIRATSIPYGGQWDPVGGGVYGNYHVPDPWRMPSQSLRDMDNSVGMYVCNTQNGDGFPPLGDVTNNDRYGFFGDAGKGSLPAGDPCCNIPYYYPSTSMPPSAIVTYGIPVVIMSPEDDFSGGIGLGVANPKNADTSLKIRLYSTNSIYDYNSTVAHPPNFVYDRGPGIDYLGYYDMKVLPADPQVNFAEMQVVDHALQSSKVNYTDGVRPTSSFPPPTPQIKADYDPVLFDYSNFRSYSGGQTHTGRAIPVDASIKSKGHGWNAYPAIFEMYKKLGSEFFPISDYGLYFVLRDAQKNHYTFDPRIHPSMLLANIKVTGPFMTPKYYSPADKKLDTSYKYEGVENVPITYDVSGEIIVDSTSSGLWETEGQRVNRVTNPSTSLPVYTSIKDKNKIARYTHSLYYGEASIVTRPPSSEQTGGFYEGDYPKDNQTENGQYQYWFTTNARYYTSWMFYSPSVGYGPTSYQTVPSDYSNTGCFMFAFDELIPTGPGNISIEVETANGVKKIYQDCCQENITDGIDVQGLKINVETPKTFMVDSDNTLDITLEETDKKHDPDATVPCNDAVLVAWQDRGIINHNTGRIEGAGDGWISNPPRSSDFIELGTQYLPADDINRNGKVSYQDYETEIVGSYDLATNTWTSGLIDARTFQRGNGKYHMEFSRNNGSQIDLVGMDFGGINLRTKNSYSPPDGVVGDDEVLPIIITAYKYGDDNNDRGFTPLYNLESEFPQYSHEVYLTGRKQIDVLSQNVWTVATVPDVLTAGVQPELQDSSEPLTFQVTDESGNPVDLLQQAEDLLESQHIDDNLDIDPHAVKLAVLNQLIKDPHPDPLPQYYWTRTDLHNDDGSLIGNVAAYSSDKGRFEPIKFDMSNSKEGRYAFKGFVANDAGNFDVFIYSIDRRRMGKVKVKVELPEVSYKVTNYDDPSKTSFDVPGNPDFVLTAGDNKIYKIKVSAKDAQGRPINGVGASVSVCGGSASEVARFTPFATTPQNFYRAIQPWYWHYYGTGKPTYGSYYMYNGTYSKIVYGAVDYGAHWDIHFGVDENNNGILEPENREIERTRDMRFTIFYSSSYGSVGYTSTSGRVYYATENVKYDNGTFGVVPFSDANLKLSETEGWGNGCIYNRPYYTPGNYGMMFANFDKRGDDNRYMQYLNISNTDSINLNQDGETEFYVFGDDICEIGGLVGKNMWSISPFGDVVGSPSGYEPSSPSHFTTRYGKQVSYVSWYYARRAYWAPKDYSYRLDWDSMPSNTVKLVAPQVEVYTSSNLEPLGKSLFDPEAYDLVYGKANHLEFKFYPADKRDLPLDDEIMMILTGNKTEFRVTSRVNPTDEKAGSAAESLMMITPTGTGLETISLDLSVKNTRLEMERCEVPYGSIKYLPKEYYLLNLARFDVAKGLNIEVTSLSGALEVNASNEIKVIISEIGTKKSVENVNIKVEGPGINSSAKTDKNGIAYLTIKPNADKAITVIAEKDDYVSGSTAIDIGCSTGRSDPIMFNAMDERTNEKRYEIKGTVDESIKTLAINKTKVKIEEDNSFSYVVYLVEGMNTILIEAEDNKNRVSRKILSVELKTNGPKVLYDKDFLSKEWIDVQTVQLSGKIEDKSTMKVNGIDSEINGINWTLELPVSLGNNSIKVEAIDDLGNKVTENYNLYVYHQRKVECSVGQNEALVDGVTVNMQEAPFLRNNRTYLDLKFISAVFELEYKWNSESKGILLTKDDMRIEMAVDSNKAVVNGNVITMDAPPITKSGNVCVPIHFVSEIFKANVQWNQRIKMITIEFLV